MLLLSLSEGAAQVNVLDHGQCSLSAGEWCVLRDHTAASSLFTTAQVRGCIVELPVDCYRESAEDSPALPPKLLACVCGDRQAAFFLKGQASGRLAELTLNLSHFQGNSLAALMMVQSKAAEFVSRVLDRPEFQESTGCNCDRCYTRRDLEAFEKAAEYLAQHLDAPHSLQELSRKFFINECKLKQGFKEHYNATVFGYLRQKRMEHAMRLLKDSTLTVLDVANLVGYTNASHFARAFREVNAMNPRDVRRSVAVA